jgi:hypothetical protein
MEREIQSDQHLVTTTKIHHPMETMEMIRTLLPLEILGARLEPKQASSWESTIYS